MKITAIETLRSSRHQTLILVRLHTDQGLTGLGESWFGPEVVETDIHSRIAPLLIGEDPARIEHLNRKMRPYAGFFGTGAEMRALSACDVALWDIAGKAANRPLCDLIGGRVRDRIQLYNTCAGPDYVSKTSDVRPDNFGLGEQGQGGDRYADWFREIDPVPVHVEVLRNGRPARLQQVYRCYGFKGDPAN